jgi:RloB-like protein
MARRKPPPKSLKRRSGFRQPKKTLAVFCEGKLTEPEYLDALKRLPAVHDVAAVDIRVERSHGGAVPLTLVNLAIEARNRNQGNEDEIDEYWCVFDVEWPRNHPNLTAALDLARANQIQLAISNPCFEIWLAFHFTDSSAWLDNDGARRLRRNLDGQADKGLSADTYMPKRSEAVRRAILMEKRHRDNQTLFPNDNPSSGMHRLVTSVDPSLVSLAQAAIRAP